MRACPAKERLVTESGRSARVVSAQGIVPGIVFLLLFFSSSSIPQEIGLPFVRNYSPKEYDNTSQVWGAIQDNDGVLYFGMTNGGGIAEYDGREWRVIDIPNKTTVFSFVKDRNGLIYTGAINDFGYMQDDSLGKKTFVSLRHLLHDQQMKFRAVWQAVMESNEVYFLSVEAIFRYSPSPNPSIKTYLPAPGSSLYGLFSHEGSVYVYQRDHGLMRVGGDSLELVSAFFKDKMFRNGVSLSPDSLLIFTRTAGIFLYRPSTGTSTPFVTDDPALAGVNIYSSTMLQNSSFMISVFGKGALLVSPGGNVFQQWNENSGLTTNAVYSMSRSSDDNLWLMTENGIARTDGSMTWSFWSKANGLRGTVIDILRYQGTLYVATFDGVFFIDKRGAVNRVSGIPEGQCWSLFDFETENRKHIMLAGTAGGIFEIHGSSSRLVRSGRYGLTMVRSRVDPQRLFIVDDPLLASIRYENGMWKNEGVISGVRDNIRRIVEDENGDLWLGTYNAGVIRVAMDQNNILKPKAIRYYTREHGLPSLTTVLPTVIRKTIAFTTEKGLYVHNPVTDMFEPYKGMHPRLSDRTQETGIIRELRDSSIIVFPWSNRYHDPGILQFRGNGLYEWIYKPFRRLGRMEFHTVREDPDGVLWIGTTEGLLRYDRKRDLKNYDREFHALIRTVALKGGRILSYGKTVSQAVVSYDTNNVTFQMAAPFFDDESKTRFRYQLQGYEEDWSMWSANASASYTNLDEGEYTFRVMARNLFDKESSIAEFRLTVLPPWFRTWWAYLSYGIILVVSVGLFDSWNKKRLKRLHDRQYEEEKLLQQQFSRQLLERQEEDRRRISREMHDNLGQELLVLKHQIQLNLRQPGTSESAKTALEGYSDSVSGILDKARQISHDLRPPELDRLGLTETLRSILGKVRDARRFELVGELDDLDGVFRKEDEINIVRILQEALSNTLKHSQATRVSVMVKLHQDVVEMRVSDNGKGISAAMNGVGAGMRGMEERASLLGGSVKIESRNGKGATLSFRFPRKQNV